MQAFTIARFIMGIRNIETCLEFRESCRFVGATCHPSTQCAPSLFCLRTSVRQHADAHLVLPDSHADADLEGGVMARSHLCLFGSFIRLVYPNKPASRSHLCLFAHLSNPTAIAHNVPCYRFYRVQIVQRHRKGASTSASRCSVLNLDIATPKCSYACSTDRSSQ